ncbi:MAG TPA: hypothetical protein VFK11_00285 [Candidatus Saccharimonadales bacterium]|nr:hypothetical protein [Candidatus Saccharimonadales bacterium]
MPPQDEKATWAYKPEEPAANPKPEQPKNKKPITWTASEFVHRHKSSGWYTVFFLGIVVLSVLVYLLTKDIISVVAIAMAGIIFLILAGRKPHQLTFEINDEGITIDKKFYPYNLFRSFGLAQEDGIRSINFMPLKRFMPELSLYFPPDQEAAIVSFLSDHLPHSEHTERTVDKLARKLNF